MSDRKAMLKELQEISFTADDLNLYLDTHPLDMPALEAFMQANTRRKNLLEQFAREFEPLTRDCVYPDTNNQSGFCTDYPGQKHFTWIDGPLPWDREGGVL